MPDSASRQNTLSTDGRTRRSRIGDVPDAIERRYYTDDRGGSGRGFYIDSTVARPAFRDHGHQLAAERADPNVIRDMTEIAQHRGWTIVTARGSPEFRREAWLAGRRAGLEVRGYQPTERDLQELDRRQGQRDPVARRPEARPENREDRRGASQMRVVEAIVRSRVQDEESQQRIMERARTRIADWLERGATFEPHRTGRSAPERQRAR